MTWEAGVSGAVCAVCRSQSSRMAVAVRMASRLHMASTVCKHRSSSRQPVLRTLWKSSISHLHLYQVTRCQASSAVVTVTQVTKIHSNGSMPSGGSGSQTRISDALRGLIPTPYRTQTCGCLVGRQIDIGGVSYQEHLAPLLCLRPCLYPVRHHDLLMGDRLVIEKSVGPLCICPVAHTSGQG